MNQKSQTLLKMVFFAAIILFLITCDRLLGPFDSFSFYVPVIFFLIILISGGRLILTGDGYIRSAVLLILLVGWIHTGAEFLNMIRSQRRHTFFTVAALPSAPPAQYSLYVTQSGVVGIRSKDGSLDIRRKVDFTSVDVVSAYWESQNHLEVKTRDGLKLGFYLDPRGIQVSEAGLENKNQD